MGKKLIRYGFEFDDDSCLFYDIELDSKTLLYQRKNSNIEKESDWALLENNQCENCPLTKSDCSYCPVALNLAEVVEATKDKISFVKANVVVQLKERSYCKSTTLQDGLFSLFGVIMATSGCPRLDWLRPMVKFHLPFASVEETLYRAVTMYLFKLYLENRNGQKVNLDLKGLLDKYQEVEIVNQGILKRINSFAKGDADKNALVALNIFAQMFACEWDNDFDLLASMFSDLKVAA